MLELSQKPINVKFFLLFIPAAYSSYLFHELGHWSIGELLGYNMGYSLNYVWLKEGSFLQASHELFESMGGPGFSILQSLLAMLVIEKYTTLYAYPFAFFPMFSRLFSLAFGGFARQDEAGIATLLGAGKYLVAIIVLVILVSIVTRSSLKLKIGIKDNCFIFTASTVCQLLVIGTYEWIL